MGTDLVERLRQSKYCGIFMILTLMIVPLQTLQPQEAYAHGSLDQGFLPFSTGGPSIPNSQPLGQEFTPLVNNLVAVELTFFLGADTTADIRVTIRQGNIGGQILGQTTQTVSVPSFFTTVHFDFPSVVPLTPNIIHVIQVESVNGKDLKISTGSPGYPGGQAIVSGSRDPSQDFRFETFFQFPPGAGLIVIEKFTSGGDGTFGFTITGPSPSTQSITTVGGTGTVGIFVAAGTYSVSESAMPAGFTLDQTRSSCTAGTPSNFTVSPGGRVFCGIVNTFTPPAVMKGDINGDGKHTVGDLIRLADGLSGRAPLSPENQIIADVFPAKSGTAATCGDGVVDINDLLALIDIVLGRTTVLAQCG